jgi:hypothetical protein
MGILFQVPAPLFPENNAKQGLWSDEFDPFLDGDDSFLGEGKRIYREAVPENLRLAVIQRRLHYYRRTARGDEYEIQPQGSLAWLPSVPLHLCPPATEEQLRTAEELLGFSLPFSLRGLYQHVANGGFGPGHEGLFCLPGCEDAPSWLLTEQYLCKADRPSIELAACEYRPITSYGYARYLADWELVVPQGYWPDRLLPLSHDGCAIYYFLDVPTGRVFLSGDDQLALRLMAHSVEELFERWMRDDLYRDV